MFSIHLQPTNFSGWLRWAVAHCRCDNGQGCGRESAIGWPNGKHPCRHESTHRRATHGGPILGIDARNGKVVWNYNDTERSPEVKSSPALWGNTAFVTTRNRRLLALDVETGNLQWEAILRKRSDSSPIVCDGKVYVGAADGRLYAFDAKNGKEVWVKEFQGAFAGSPAIADGKLLIATDKGSVFCLGAKP